jgi:hypothetical protein
MSWYLANEKEIIDQFASGLGLSDLRREIETNRFPALQDFIDEGVTVNITECVEELNQLVKKTHDESVRVTAQGLAGMMRGQSVAVITQGFEYEDDEDDDDDEVDESPEAPEPAKPAKRAVAKGKKKAVSKKKPAARKAQKPGAPKKNRLWFETKVAELKTEAERLPAARQMALRTKLKEKPKGGR